jgi:RimJ/RimL family protein N-acetyltransferase
VPEPFELQTARPSQAVMRRIGMARDVGGDFAHPLIGGDSPLSAHVLYRLSAEDWRARSHRRARA